MCVCRMHVSISCTGTLCHRCRSDPTVPTCDMWSGPSLHQQIFVTSIIVHQQRAINFFINNYPAQRVLLPISMGLKMAYCCERIATYTIRIQTHYQDCQQRDCVRIYFESLTILKVMIPPRMSQMNKILRALIVATTLDPHLIITILCWKAITLHLHLKEKERL